MRKGLRGIADSRARSSSMPPSANPQLPPLALTVRRTDGADSAAGRASAGTSASGSGAAAAACTRWLQLPADGALVRYVATHWQQKSGSTYHKPGLSAHELGDVAQDFPIWGWDWCLVFKPVELELMRSGGAPLLDDPRASETSHEWTFEVPEKVTEFVERLRGADLSVLVVAHSAAGASNSAVTLTVLVGARLERLEKHAEHTGMRLKQRAPYGSPHIMPVAPFANAVRHRYEGYLRETETHDCFFTSLERSKLILEIMETKQYTNPDCAGVNVTLLMHRQSKNDVALLQSFFPLHNRKEQQALREEWQPTQTRFWKRPPLQSVAAYLGDPLGFYFAWLHNYNLFLIPPTILGILLEWYRTWLGRDDSAWDNVCCWVVMRQSGGRPWGAELTSRGCIIVHCALDLARGKGAG